MSILTQQQRTDLAADPDGLITYEFIANNIEALQPDDIDFLASNMISVDRSGQFLASAARYLNAINSESYKAVVRNLVAATIDRDREHRYIADLLPSIWGADYADRAEELRATDNNFRRICKRLFPSSTI